MAEQLSLKEHQIAAGAVYEENEDCEPISYGNPHGEYSVIESESSVIDFSQSRCHIQVTGGDRAKFLHNFCTADIVSLQPGQGTEAFITTIQGKVLAHVFIFVEADSIQIDAVDSAEQRILTHLQKYIITDDVELQSLTGESGELFLTGPDVPEKLSQLGLYVEELEPSVHITSSLADIPVNLRRCDWTKGVGFLLYSSRERLPELWSALIEQGFRPAGKAAFDAHRIEACMPWDGRDINEENLAQEVDRTQHAISFAKGCYLGQEPIARIDSMGHVNRALRGLQLSAGPPPSPDTPVYTATGDKEIGRITSSAICYRNDLPIAMAYLRHESSAPETEVQVQSGDEAVPGVVFWNS